MRFMISLIAIAAISAMIGYGVRMVFGFWEATALSAATLLIAIYWTRAVQISYGKDIIQELTDDLDSFLNRTQCGIKCPCGHVTTMPVFMGEDVEIICDKCDNKFIAIPSIETRLLTDPRSTEVVYDKLRNKMLEVGADNEV